MDNIFSVYLIAAIIAWLIAQFIKLGLAIRQNSHSKDYSVLFKSGNMPSSHTATMVALSTTIAVTQGVGSAIFGVVAVVTAVVIYDALNVRRAVGEQGVVLKELAEKEKISTSFYRAKGHKLSEVLVGAVVGLVAGFFALSIFSLF